LFSSLSGPFGPTLGAPNSAGGGGLGSTTLTLTPLQGARNGTPISVTSWSLLSSVSNFAGTWSQYVGTIPGADEGVVVYMWTGPSNWRCLQIAGKMGPLLTHYTNGSGFFTDPTLSTPIAGPAPNVFDYTPLAFNASVTEDSVSIPWICGAYNVTKTSLSNLQVHYSVPLFCFNSVPAMNISRVIELVKQWKLYGVYGDTDLGPVNSILTNPTATTTPTLGITGSGYSPENAAPTSANASTYQTLVLAGIAGDNWTGRSFYEADEASLLSEAIAGRSPANPSDFHWRLMSKSLNLARVPLYCTWDDSVHRVNNPQKGSRKLIRFSIAASDPAYGYNCWYVNSAGNLAITHPWSGTSYFYEATGCPIFAIINSGVLSFQIATEYAWKTIKPNPYSSPVYAGYTGYAPAAIDTSVDRAESWAYSRLSKLKAELPSTGRVPGAFSAAEINEMISEMPLAPDNYPTYSMVGGTVSRTTRRAAQTSPGSSVASTLTFLDGLLNLPMTTTAESNNLSTGSTGDEFSGAWFSNVMFLYAFESAILHAINGSAQFLSYLENIITCYERFAFAYGYGNLYRSEVNFNIGPQVTGANAGVAYPLQNLNDIKTRRQGYGAQGYVTNYASNTTYSTSPGIDNKFFIIEIRLMRLIDIAGQKGRLPSALGTRAATIRSGLIGASNAVTTGLGGTSFGNYIGVPPSLESLMS
jgi:hypothetical protein